MTELAVAYWYALLARFSGSGSRTKVSLMRLRLAGGGAMPQAPVRFGIPGMSSTILQKFSADVRLGPLGPHEDAFAAGLAVEQPIGLLGLGQLPAMREQVVDCDLAVGDEAGAVRLSNRGKGP